MPFSTHREVPEQHILGNSASLGPSAAPHLFAWICILLYCSALPIAFFITETQDLQCDGNAVIQNIVKASDAANRIFL